MPLAPQLLPRLVLPGQMCITRTGTVAVHSGSLATGISSESGDTRHATQRRNAAISEVVVAPTAMQRRNAALSKVVVAPTAMQRRNAALSEVVVAPAEQRRR